MRVAVLTREKTPTSQRVYRANLEREFALLGGLELAPFHKSEPIPRGCEVLWDPSMGMGAVASLLRRCPIPVVVTVHGLRAFSLPLSEISANLRERAKLYLSRTKTRMDWHWFAPRVAQVIAVSRYGADEVIRALHVPAQRVHAIHHGVDLATFRPDGQPLAHPRPFFLHVSVYKPIKNVARLFEAYAKLPAARPDLIAVLPNYSGPEPVIPGLQIIRTHLTPEQLAAHYRAAIGFVFPSLRETFGLPVLEAMACGCPVVASNTAGCAEVAGEDAILINPRDVADIASAMARIADDPALRGDLRRRGLARAATFTWAASARSHLEVFKLAATGVRA